jgi:uncharacterized membrane protein
MTLAGEQAAGDQPRHVSLVPRRLARKLEREGSILTAIIVVAVLGVGVAGYLVYIHYAKVSPLCLGGSHKHSSCITVQSSSYAKLAGIPVALLGLLGYILILASLAIPGESGRVSGFAIALTGFGFSMYLTYREIFTIKAICEWCVSSATLLTLLTILTAVRYLRGEPATR